MPYPQYQQTWQIPYVAQAQGYQQPLQPYQQPTQQQKVLVDGPTEAMNRFLMRYPAHQLVPGFISDELFDVNGRQFHVLSVEADGRRRLETFDYKPHVEQRPINVDGADFVSREEFDEFTKKVNAALGAINGIHGPVQAAATAAGAATTAAAAAGAVHAAGNAPADGAGAADLPRHAAGI